MKRLTCGLFSFATLGALTASSADARSQVIDNFARDRNVSVRERPHPEFEAVGGRLGAFTLYPKVEVRAEATDNVYATDANRVEDGIGRLLPSAALVSGWSRHALTLYADADIARFVDRSDESYETYRAGFTSRIDLMRTSSLDVAASSGRFVEPRTNANTPASAARPIDYALSNLELSGVRTFNRLRLSAEFAAEHVDYDDGRTVAGAIVEQDNRDRAAYDFTLQGDHAVSPATAVFVRAAWTSTDYETAGTLLQPARDSDGYRVFAGVDFDLTDLARGEVAVGYFAHEFEAVAYDRSDGYAVQALVEYFPTRLTTLTASASRSLQDAAIVGAGGFVSTNIGIRADVEVRRNIILTGSAAYGDDAYQGIDRSDIRTNLSLGATYLMSRNLGLSVGYARLEQDSSGASRGTDFAQQRLSISLVTQF